MVGSKFQLLTYAQKPKKNVLPTNHLGLMCIDYPMHFTDFSYQIIIIIAGYRC